MKIAFDCNSMVAWCGDNNDDKIKLEHAIKNATVICPMPALAEFLVGADSTASAWLDGMEKKANFKALPFDRRAAAECAMVEVAQRKTKKGKRGESKKDWQAVKFDRQILAIVKVHGADLLISNDTNLAATAKEFGIACQSIAELPLPEYAKQRPLL